MSFWTLSRNRSNVSLFGYLKKVILEEDHDDELVEVIEDEEEVGCAVESSGAAMQVPEAPPLDEPDEIPWWEVEHVAPPKSVKFEGVNSRQIYLELLNKIKLNKFTVIEIPDNLLRIINLLNDREFSYQEVEDIFNRSGSLTGEVIKIANSAVYSRGSKINRIRDALTRLGPNKIKAVLYLHSSRNAMCEDERFVKLARGVIEHSYVVGQIASYLSLRYYPDPDNAFLAGLLHDIGKLGIIKELADYYDFPETQTNISENSFGEVIPMLHELAGRFIAKNWNMSEDISFAIENHHQPNHFLVQNPEHAGSELATHLTTLIHVSDIMARMNGKGMHIGKIDFFNLPAVAHLGITNDPETRNFLREIPAIVATSDVSET